MTRDDFLANAIFALASNPKYANCNMEGTHIDLYCDDIIKGAKELLDKAHEELKIIG